MKNTEISLKPVIATIILANVLWFATFFLEFSTFWIKIGVSASILAILSFFLKPRITIRFKLDAGSVIMGFISAAALYFIFWAGREVSTLLFPFAEQQIGGIYGKGDGTPAMFIIPLLLFITGPCEEIFWRGCLQERLMLKYGIRQGWLLAAFFYAAVHIWSFNFMLIGAAGVAGLFWGAMYMRYRNLAPVIVSHSLWSAFIFAVIPLS